MCEPLSLKYVRDDVINKIFDSIFTTSKEEYTNLLLGTCAVESDFGSARRQHGVKNKFVGGYGIFQVEPATHDYLIDQYLLKKPELRKIVLSFYNKELSKYDNLQQNDLYLASIAYVKYLSCKNLFQFPEDPNNIEALAKIWKKYYNTILGKGKEEEFVKKYRKYVLND